MTRKGETTGSGNAKYSYCLMLFLECHGLRQFSTGAVKRRRPLSLNGVNSKGTSLSFGSEHDNVELSASAAVATKTATLLSNAVNNKDMESNTAFFVQALVDGCSNNNKDKFKQRHTVLNIDNNINNKARSLLQNSDLSFLLCLGQWFQPTKSKSSHQSRQDVL